MGRSREGIVVGDTVRCPWHHACFDLRDGEPLGRPRSIRSLLEVDPGGRPGACRQKNPPPRAKALPPRAGLGRHRRRRRRRRRRRGDAAARGLRRTGDADRRRETPPVDRPNLSKDFLAGTAPEEWIPLRPREFYAEQQASSSCRRAATADRRAAAARSVSRTGAASPTTRCCSPPGRSRSASTIPGADLPHVHTCARWPTAARSSPAPARPRRAVVMGASFIGLEVAASLRDARPGGRTWWRPDARPLETVLGPELGDFVRELHEEHGVVFRLGQKPRAIDERGVELATATRCPRTWWSWASASAPPPRWPSGPAFAVDRGVAGRRVSARPARRASSPPATSRAVPTRAPAKRVRIEHWVVAERQGQTAARNMLGRHARAFEGAVLLEPALRRRHRLRRPRRAVGLDGAGGTRAGAV